MEWKYREKLRWSRRIEERRCGVEEERKVVVESKEKESMWYSERKEKLWWSESVEEGCVRV